MNSKKGATNDRRRKPKLLSYSAMVVSVSNTYVYTVTKTSQIVKTESREEGEKKRFVRVLEIGEGQVTITINLDSLAEILASKVPCSASGKSRSSTDALLQPRSTSAAPDKHLYRAV
jgi:hypothetical protein